MAAGSIFFRGLTGSVRFAGAETSPATRSFIDVHIHLMNQDTAAHIMALNGGGSGESGAPGAVGADNRPKAPLDPRSRRAGPLGRPPGGAGENSERGNYPAATAAIVALMDQYGVEKAIILPPPGATDHNSSIFYARRAEEYSRLTAAAKKHPGRLYMGGGGHNLNAMIHSTPAASVTREVRASFRKEAEHLARSGIKVFGEMAALHIAPHAFDQAPPDHPLFLLLADIAAENNIPIDLHMEAVVADGKMPPGFFGGHTGKELKENISGLERLLDHNRNTRIVWQHVGWDYMGTRSVSLLRGLLAKHSNLFLAIRSHNPATMKKLLPNRIHDDAWKIKPEWLSFFQEYPDRFVVGSDEFVGPSGIIKGQTAQPSFSNTWPLLDQLPSDLARKIGRDNAVRIYALN